MTQKRTRNEDDETESMANCLMLLSKIDESISPKSGRIFQCKSCKKQFQSFQALGGHMASHKKLKLMASDFINQSHLNSCKPKKHECPICGIEFNMGQALGGHMRRHRAVVDSGGEAAADRGGDQKQTVAVLKRSNSKRVFGLDLNLMPFENEMKLEMKTAPAINFFV